MAPLVLRDALERSINLRQYRGKLASSPSSIPTAIYTHCPDVCPLIVSHLKTAQAELGPMAKRLQIIFWASWCDPYRKEAPKLEHLDRSCAAAHTSSKWTTPTKRMRPAPSFRQYGWTFPVLSDPDGIYRARYEFTGPPTTIVLDSHGRVVET